MAKLVCQRRDELVPQVQVKGNQPTRKVWEDPPPRLDAQCWHQLFEARVSADPEAIAVVHGGRALTYRELNEKANQLAHHLRDLGVGPETLVGLCLGRSFDLLVCLLGILKAGGAFVALPPDHPPERLEHMLRDSGLQVVVAQRISERRLLAVCRSNQLPVVVSLDAASPVIPRQSVANPNLITQPHHLIYVIYTSGSTGEPKGVAVEHRAVVNHCRAFSRYAQLSVSDRVLQFAPMSFDVSVEEILPTLISGGRVVMRPDGLMFSLAEFHTFITQEQTTILNLPTSYWNEWMKEIERRGLALPPSLRLVISGSETVTARHLARWRKVAGKRVRWWNAYGTTEATITSTIYETEAEGIPDPVPIGRPLPGTKVYLLDSHGQPVPDGEAGEICIGGDRIARGYFQQPALTAWRFVPDPFSSHPGARMNRTGDYARRLPDGNLEFLGRRDDQVNVRGFRVELGEIETALQAIPDVSEAAVVTRGEDGIEKRLVAYVVLARSRESSRARGSMRPAGTIAKLRQMLAKRLPPYMIPATFVSMDSLPRQANGKLDRLALPIPGSARPDLEQSLVNPADELESNLAAIWRDVLNLETVGVQDDFFDLGGHSLQAVRVVSALSALTRRRLPLRILYEFPTIRRLAGRIRQKQPADNGSTLMAIQPQGLKPPLFLVHGAGGGMVWGYANLARHLGAGQPVYAFQSEGLDGGEEFARVEDMAARYVADLQAFQARGPYRLGGYCFGGEVAFEMAQQLQARGESVESLILFNAMPRNSSFEQPRLNPAFIARSLVNSWQWLRYFLNWPFQAKQSFLLRKVRLARHRLGCLLGSKHAPSVSGEAGCLVDLSLYSQKRRELWDLHLRASAQYWPRPYTGNVVLFRTPIFPFFCSFDPTFGWKEFVKGILTVKVIPGAHESILDEPHVGQVAQEVAGLLDSSRDPRNRQIGHQQQTRPGLEQARRGID